MTRVSLSLAIYTVLSYVVSPVGSCQNNAPLIGMKSGGGVYFLEFSGDSRHVVGAVAETTQMNVIKIWNAETGEVVQSMALEPISVYRHRIAVSWDAKTLAVGKEYTVSLYDVESGGHLRDIPVSESRPFALAFSPNGRALAVEANASVEFLEIETGEKLDSVRFDDADGIASLAFAPDASRLLVGYYHVEPVSPMFSTEVYGSALLSLPDKEILASYGQKYSSMGERIAYSPEGSLYALYHNPLYVYDAIDFSLVWEAPSPNSRAASKLAFSPDGTRLLWGPALHDAQTGEVLREFPMYRSDNEVAYSRDGNRVAIEDLRNGTVTIWDVSDLNTAVQDWLEREQKVRRVDGVK